MSYTSNMTSGSKVKGIYYELTLYMDQRSGESDKVEEKQHPEYEMVLPVYNITHSISPALHLWRRRLMTNSFYSHLQSLSYYHYRKAVNVPVYPCRVSLRVCMDTAL